MHDLLFLLSLSKNSEAFGLRMNCYHPAILFRGKYFKRLIGQLLAASRMQLANRLGQFRRGWCSPFVSLVETAGLLTGNSYFKLLDFKDLSC